MAYIAYWGMLFCFGVILLQGRHWWHTALLVISAAFVVLIGPSRIYLGEHWASDVLGAYLIGGVLLGLAILVYLPLKERGVLQTPRALARMKRKRPVSVPNMREVLEGFDQAAKRWWNELRQSSVDRLMKVRNQSKVYVNSLRR